MSRSRYSHGWGCVRTARRNTQHARAGEPLTARTIEGGAHLHRGSSGAAELEHVVPVQLHALAHQRIHVGRLHVSVASRPVPASVGPSEIIKEDMKYIGQR
eukprot:COSAG01_NODE_5280_length_4359_cov_2.299296_3_plen_101_part_00